MVKICISNYFIFIFIILNTSIGLSQQYFIEHTIDASYLGASAIDLKDFNKDGKIDIVAGSHGTPTVGPSGVKCWINNGTSPVSFSGQVVDASYAAITCYSEDLNMDGFVDILAGSWNSGNIVYWINSGTNPITWTRYTLATGFRNAHGVYACDIDNDGDNDVLGAASGTNEIAVWYNNGGNPPAWTKQVVSNNFGQAKDAYAADLDQDGDLDIVGTSFSNNEIAWWRNDGGSPIAWTKYTIDNSFGGASSLFLSDIDRDGRIDLLSTAYYDGDIAWYHNDGGDPVGWSKQIIENNFTGVFDAISADLDNDGDNDIFGTSLPGNRQSFWLNGGGSSFVWTRYDLVTNNSEPWPAAPFDIDNDGDMDIIIGGGLRIGWWENVANCPSPPAALTAFSDDHTPTSILLRWKDPSTYNNGKPLSNYKIHVYRDSMFIAVVDSGNEQYNDINLVEHELYNYSVRTSSQSDSSTLINASAYAGGCPYSLSPTNFIISDSSEGIFLQWKNPTKHTDGSPLNDMAYVMILRDNVLSDSLEQTHLDTGQVRTYLDPVEGYHEYYIYIRDNDNPPHKSSNTSVLLAYGGNPFMQYLEEFDSGKGMIYSTGQWDTTGSISYGGDYSFTDSPGGDYPRYSNTYFLLPPVVVGEDYELKYYDIAIVSYLHNTYVEISSDKRKTYSRLAKYNSTAYPPWDDGRADSGDWRKETFNLTPYLGDTVTIRFRLEISSGLLMDGWYIDNIFIGKPDTTLIRDSISIETNTGWNIISIPTDSTYLKNDLFPQSISQVFYYDVDSLSYVAKNTLGIGNGYWLKFQSSDTTKLYGISALIDSFEVKPGWNMIGSISKPVPVATISSDPPGLITSEFYTYRSGYVSCDTIIPGIGYWIKVGEGGKLILSAQEGLRLSSRIKIISDNEVPPLPPDAVSTGGSIVPKEFRLYQNYPNPFNPITTITFDIPVKSHVRLDIYNIVGMLAKTLTDGVLEPGSYSIIWDGMDNAGHTLPAGVYFYRLESDGYVCVKKTLLIK